MEEQIKTYLETHSIKTANTQDPATKKEIEKYYENLNDFNLLNSNLKEETLAEIDRANYSNAN
jgi:predicted DNA-binding protein